MLLGNPISAKINKCKVMWYHFIRKIEICMYNGTQILNLPPEYDASPPPSFFLATPLIEPNIYLHILPPPLDWELEHV